MLIKWLTIYGYFLIISFILSVIGVKLFTVVARKYGFMDIPETRKIHNKPTPLLGGAAIFCAIFITVGLHYFILTVIVENNLFVNLLPPDIFAEYGGFALKWKKVLVFFLGGFIIFIYGVVDDRNNISPINRLIAEITVAVIVVALGIRPGISESVHVLGILIAVIWIVGITNGFNLLDGMNGLCSGNALISAAIFFIISLHVEQQLLSILLIVYIGAIGGFFIFNFPRGKIFLGSAGSMFIGYSLSVLVLLQSYGTDLKVGNPLPLVMPVLILSLPLIDTLTVMYLRFRQHRPLFKADNNHIHHRLRRLRMKDTEVVGLILMLTFAVGINATLLYKANLIDSVIILVQALVIYGIFTIIVQIRERRSNKRRNAFGIVYVEHAEDGGKKIWEGFILNISKDGGSFCLMNLDVESAQKNVFIGKQLNIKMLPSGQSYHGATPFLQLQGRAVWDQKIAENAMQLGVRFSEPLKDERRLIDKMFYQKEIHGDVVEALQ